MKPRLQTWGPLFVALALAGSAGAQGWLDDGIAALQGICKAGQTLGSGSLDFVCSTVKLLQDSKDKLETFTGDITGLWDDTKYRVIGQALDRVGARAGTDQINAWVTGIDQSLATGYGDLLKTANAYAGEARNRSLARLFDPPADPDSPAGRLTRLLRLNPNVAAKAALTVNAQAETAADAIKVAGTGKEVDTRVEDSLKRIGDGMRDNVLALTNPTQTGLADKMRDSAATVLSSRGGIQRLIETNADLALQFASGINQMLAVNQDQLLVQARTSAQIATFVQQYLREKQQQQLAWKSRLEGDLDGLEQRSKVYADNLNYLSTLFEGMGK